MSARKWTPPPASVAVGDRVRRSATSLEPARARMVEYMSGPIREARERAYRAEAAECGTVTDVRPGHNGYGWTVTVEWTRADGGRYLMHTGDHRVEKIGGAS